MMSSSKGLPKLIGSSFATSELILYLMRPAPRNVFAVSGTSAEISRDDTSIRSSMTKRFVTDASSHAEGATKPETFPTKSVAKTA